LCHERIVVTEGAPGTINQTRLLLDEIAALKINPRTISVVLNNRHRSESQMPWAQVQEKLGHSITTTLTPAPELFMQAARLRTFAVLAQPTSVAAQQILKVADLIIEREKAR
jgi:MinD-like ATPase involved in chromosome partitioning or flagellar assembly